MAIKATVVKGTAIKATVVKGTVVTVLATPTALTDDNLEGGDSYQIYVPVDGQTVFVGGPGVTIASGYPYLAGTEHRLSVDRDARVHVAQILYGVVASDTQVVDVLAQGII
jgi:hypothetical protein